VTDLLFGCDTDGSAQHCESEGALQSDKACESEEGRHGIGGEWDGLPLPLVY
jgi:hypothetical protein